MMTLLPFLVSCIFCALAAAGATSDWRPFSGELRAPDTGTLQPYFESIGKNVLAYRTMFTNILSPEEAAFVQAEYDAVLGPASPVQPYDVLLPELDQRFPNMSSPACIGCQFALTTLRTLVDGLSPRSYEDLRPILMPFCEMLMYGRPGKEICPGVLDNYGPLVVDIVKDTEHQKSVLESCIFLNECPPPEFNDHNEGLEEVYLPKAPVFSGYDVFDHEMEEDHDEASRDRRSAGTFRVVQLADVHFDDEYAVGSVAECSFHVCCRSNYNGTGTAHSIGEYTCNVPMSTVKMFLDRVASLEPDLVLQTGDTPPHHLWYETPERQVAATNWLAQEIKARMGGIPVIPSIGNHDVFPSNMFYMKRNATKDTIKALIDGYPVLSDPELQGTFNKGGYFEYQVKSGLRALVYNSNYGYTDNWYNLLSHFEEADYLDMRQYIEKRLAAARNDKVKVILVAHHPVGDGIIPFDNWVSDLRIKYSDIVVLHVAGHHHTDEFNLFTRAGDRWASGVMFAAPSSNSMVSINPSLRVYELDSRNFHLRDYKQYHLDIAKAQKLAVAQEANAQVLKTTKLPGDEIVTSSPAEETTTAVPVPEIEFVYSAREEYGMHDLSPASWHDLAIRMIQNITLLHRYQRNFGTGVADGSRGLCGEEDTACHTKVVCDVLSSTLLANMRCNRDGVKLPEGLAPTEEPFTEDPNAASTAQSSILATIITLVLSYLIHFNH